MITKIQLQKDATILAENGKKVGSLVRLVINPDTYLITDLVVRTGGLLGHEEKIVPIELVVETAEDKILLHEDAGDLEGFPPLEEKRLVSEHGAQGRESSPGRISPVFGALPEVGTPVVRASNPQIVTRLEFNIPEGTIPMKFGAKVTSADAEDMGNVDRVLAEPFMAKITHLYVSKGLLIKEADLIPIEWVLRIGEDMIHLRLNKDAVEETTAPPVAG